MEIEKIRALIDELTGVMDAKELDELEIEADGIRVLLRRGSRGGDAPAVVMASTPAAAPGPAIAPADEPAAAAADAETRHVVQSPMVGTFYRAPAPDADPFIEVGDEVTPDTVVCIIEAMKVMNELKAEVEGVVEAIRAEGGEAVEYGQPLFVIRTEKP